MSDRSSATPKVSVWDLPTRLFHWSLLACVILAWRTAETRDMALHRIVGSAIAGLLIFRLWWGIFGSSTARFSQFLKGPGQVLNYGRTLFSKQRAPTLVGHNPMGGWSVAALLICLILLVFFGLFAVDTDGLESGPFANLISFDLGRMASHWHARLFDGLEILVCLHLAAILFYHVFKRENLVGAMVTGKRVGEKADVKETAAKEPVGMKKGSILALVIGLVLSVSVSLLIAHLGGAF